MSIESLLIAAEYLERREKESEREHGYACIMPPEFYETTTSRKSKSKPLKANRSSHNELEKTRRATLKHYLEALKKLVPVGPSSTRHTTLGLLNNAKSFVLRLEKETNMNEHLVIQLRAENRRLDELYRSICKPFSKHRSNSECSTLSASSDPDEFEQRASSSRSISPSTDSDELISLVGVSTNLHIDDSN